MNIYVGNLPYTTTEEELREQASQYGELTSCTIIIDRETGRSRGFGFIEMANEDEAEALIEGLNGSNMGGRMLTVNKARPRAPRGGGGGGGYGGGGGGYGGGGGGYGGGGGGYGGGRGGGGGGYGGGDRY
jgi:RNA recognition motif-containing protein